MLLVQKTLHRSVLLNNFGFFLIFPSYFSLLPFLRFNIDFGKQAVFDGFLVPFGKNERVIDLTQRGKMLTFINFSFDFRDDNLAETLWLESERLAAGYLA